MHGIQCDEVEFQNCIWNPVLLDSDRIGQNGTYSVVRTSTYQYKTVQASTRIPSWYIPVCTSTYRYVPLRSPVVFWPTQKESGEMRSGLYIAYAWDTMWRGRISKLLKFSKIQVHTGTYWYTGNTWRYKALYSLVPSCTSLFRGTGHFWHNHILPCTALYRLVSRYGIARDFCVEK